MVASSLLVPIDRTHRSVSIYQQDGINTAYETRSAIERSAQTILAVDGLAARLSAGFAVLSAQAAAGADSRHGTGAPAIEENIREGRGRAITDLGRKLFARIGDDARALKPQLDRLAATGAALVAARTRMFESGNTLAHLTKRSLRTSVTATAEGTLSRAAGVETVVLEARLAAARYAIKSDPRDFDAYIRFMDEVARRRRRVQGDSGGAHRFSPPAAALQAALDVAFTSFQSSIRRRTPPAQHSKAGSSRMSRPSTRPARLCAAGSWPASTGWSGSQPSRQAARRVEIGLIGLALVLGGVLAFLLARSVGRPIALR